jgi:hypothetical protein
MRQIEVINLETIIDVTAETSNVEILVQDYDAELVERFALEAQEAAIDAEESADIATAQASIATAQATIATTQAGIATTQAGIATTQAGIATTKANEASASAASALASEQAADADRIAAQAAATTATTQAGISTTQAGIATTKAGEASASAASALASENSASSSASTANTQAGIATTQAGIATTQAGIATTQAGNALTSANNAAASAAAAAQVGTSTLLTGLPTLTNTAITATDSILQAFAETQGQINARVSGTIAEGRVAFGTAANTIGGDSGLIYDNTNKRLGVGTLTPLGILTSSGTNAAHGTTGIPPIPTLLLFRSTSSASNYAGLVIQTEAASSNFGLYSNQNGALFFHGGTERMRITSAGNLLVGTTTDAGFRLDVNGTARVQGLLTATANNTTGVLSVINSNSSVSISMASLLAASATGDTYFTIGRALTNNNSALIGHSTVGGGNYAFITVFGRPANDFAITSTGSIGIGTSLPNASARLQIDSTTQGFLPPRMTSAQRNLIGTPATGLVVYNTTDNRLSVFNGTSWVNLATI